MKKESIYLYNNCDLIKSVSLKMDQKDKKQKELFANIIHNNSSNFNNKKEFNGNIFLDISPFYNNKTSKNKLFKKKQNMNLNKMIFILLISIIISIMIQISKSDLIKKLNGVYEIKIVHLRAGFQKIINTQTKPEKVIIKGENMDLSRFPIVNIGEPNSTITIIWNSLPSCKQLFSDMNNILSIDLSNFDTSEVTDMTEMFCNCANLKNINFKNLNTEKVEKMDKMFYNSPKIITLDISSFVTTSLKSMGNMFNTNVNLISLDLSNFDISSVTNMEGWINNCPKLIYLNIKSFTENKNNSININNMNLNNKAIVCVEEDKAPNIYKLINDAGIKIDCDHICFGKTSKVSITETKCVENCNKEKYIIEIERICYENIPVGYVNPQTENYDNSQGNENNKYNYDSTITTLSENKQNEINTIITDNQQNEITNIISENKHNEITTIIAENQQNSIAITTFIAENKQNEITTTDVTENKQNEITTIIEENKQNEITTIISENKQHEKTTIIEENKQNEITTIIIENQQNAVSTNIIENKQNIMTTDSLEKKQNEINKNDMEKNSLIFSTEKFFESSQQKYYEKLNKDDIIKSITKEIINGNMNSLLNNLINGTKEDLVVETEDMKYQITTTENQKNKEYNNMTTINLGECENNLKDKYGINQNLSLIIFKIEYNMKGLLIPVIGYEVYHPLNYSQLDLNYCNDILAKINIPVVIEEDKEFLYDPNSDYYNDDCYAYTTQNGTDIILNDRKNEYIDNNLSLCENNCTFNGYDSNKKKALCECQLKVQINLISEIIKDENLLSNSFTINDNNKINVGTMKCVSLLFSKNGLLTNIGSYILIFSILFFGISIIIFYKCGYQMIESNIEHILEMKKKKKTDLVIYDFKQKKKSNKNTKKKKKEILSNPRKKKSFKKIMFSDKFEKKKTKEKTHTSISKSEIKKCIKRKDKMKFKNNKTQGQKKNEKKSQMKNFKEIEINYFPYQKAIIYDKRSIFQVYCFLIKTKLPFLLAFVPLDDYNIIIIKICLFFIFFDINFAVNTLFFNDDTIHQIYKDRGNYNFEYFLPQIIISFIISYIFFTLIKYFSLSERNLLELKKEENEDKVYEISENLKRCLIIKYIIFFTLNFVFLTLFWFYLSSFCAVYKNTQIYLVLNTIISILISIIYIIIFNLLPSFLRIMSLKVNKPLNKCLYNASQILKII